MSITISYLSSLHAALKIFQHSNILSLIETSTVLPTNPRKLKKTSLKLVQTSGSPSETSSGVKVNVHLFAALTG